MIAIMTQLIEPLAYPVQNNQKKPSGYFSISLQDSNTFFREINLAHKPEKSHRYRATQYIK